MLLLLLVSFAFLLFLPLFPFAFPCCVLLFLRCLLLFLLLFRLVLLLLLWSLTRSLPFTLSLLLLLRSPLFFLRLLMYLPPSFLLFPCLLSLLLFRLRVFPLPLLLSVLALRLQPFSCFLPLFVSSIAPSFLSVSSSFPSLVPPVFSGGSFAPSSPSIALPVAAVPSPSLVPSASFAPFLVSMVPRSSTNVSTGPVLSSAWGGGGGLHQFLMLLMFPAPRVPLFHSPISCSSGTATSHITRATRSLLPWGSLISRLPFHEVVSLLPASFLLPSPRTPPLPFCHLGLTTLVLSVVMTLGSFCAFSTSWLR